MKTIRETALHNERVKIYIYTLCGYFRGYFKLQNNQKRYTVDVQANDEKKKKKKKREENPVKAV